MPLPCHGTVPPLSVSKSETPFLTASDVRLVRILLGMYLRCYDPRAKGYKNWGARGISIDERWRNISAFVEWAKNNGYHEKFSIERIDVNGPYSPENCTWISPRLQSANRRNTRYITCGELTKSAPEWARLSGIDLSTIKARLARGWSAERAVWEPQRGKHYSRKNFFNRSGRNEVSPSDSTPPIPV